MGGTKVYLKEYHVIGLKYRVNNILSIFIRNYSSNNDTPIPIFLFFFYWKKKKKKKHKKSLVWYWRGKFYKDPDTMKTVILNENKGKSGIYRWTNKLNGDFYIGSSINLSGRFFNYFNMSYISSVKTI